MARVTKEDLLLGALLYPEAHPRPAARAECGPVRPCPYVGCRYHLLLEVLPNGNLKFNAPSIDHLEESCSLDVADYGGATLREVGQLLGLTPTAVAVIENGAIRRAGPHLQTLFEEWRR